MKRNLPQKNRKKPLIKKDTYTILEVSSECYAEIAARLNHSGDAHIDMHGIGLQVGKFQESLSEEHRDETFTAWVLRLWRRVVKKQGT